MTQVKFIEYEGEKIPYRLAYYALNELKKETGKGLKDLDSLDEDMELLEPLFYHSVISGYRVLHKKCPYKRDDILTILDLCYLEFMINVGGFFQQGVSKVKKVK